MIIKRLFACLSCIFLLSVVAIAAPEDLSVDFSEEILQDEIEAIPDLDLSQDLIISDSVSGSEIINQLIQQLGQRDDLVVIDDSYQLQSVQIRSLAPITGSGSGLKSTILDFVGDYDPVVVEYTYQNAQGMTQYLREIQPDYPWMISVAVLVVFIYCLFRLGGAILCKR